MKLAVFVAASILLQGCAITGAATKGSPSEEHFNHSVKFCGSSDCLAELLNLINRSTEIQCAFYSADKSVTDAIEQKSSSISASLITNKDRKKAGLMHNKFCVFDRKIVWTGSYNPAKRNSRDDVIIINSTLLAGNYLKEAEELKNNGSGRKTTTTKIVLGSTLVESYFCPEDGCIEKLQQQLEEADSSIHFATYSFTHPKISNELIIKNGEGVAVRGVIEKGGSYSQFQTLKSNGLAVAEDSSKSLLHHKFFIIDESVVITGSFNPTRNADERNDENMLVMHNSEVAARYAEEFEALWEESAQIFNNPKP